MSKKIVLEEEEYVKALGQIIEREFFPELPELKKKAELLRDEEESVTWTDQKLRLASSRGNTSKRGNTIGSGWDDSTEQSVERELERDAEDQDADCTADSSMTLNRFLVSHTSEDNESFNELQVKAVEDHRRRYHWAFDDNEEKGDPKLHLLTNGTWISHEERRIADEACAPKGPKDSRPSAPETWKFCARNPLFLVPELEATRDNCEIKAGSKNQLLLKNRQKMRTKKTDNNVRKTTIYANTRFAAEGVPASSEGNASSLRNEYPLVPMTPVIAPGVDASPLMTWGDIEGTPVILGTTPARFLSTPSFELQDTSRREKLANRLESETRHRAKTRTLGTTTPSRKRVKAVHTPTSRSVRSLSRARSVLQTPLGSDTQLRASYSTPLRPPRHSSRVRKIK